ncbi:MAG: prephenate dehydratase [Chitinivibrionales bacterium]|nr:prephenate dehydratase [Chitinivibrionales bacterium]
MSIAYAGERGAFAELAAREYFKGKQRLAATADFADVFKAVIKKSATYGIVPIENTLAGSIHQNYDLLLEHPCFIVGEICLKVAHFLLANKGVRRADIKRIYSHPQVFPQCRNFFKRYPKLEVVSIPNTALAVKFVKDHKFTDAAAIASMQAGIDFNMQFLARNIEDNKHNMTRFLVISRTSRPLKAGRGAPEKTSIVFATKDLPGALFRCLAVFALRDINLFKIESRPVHGKGFKYLFYLDFEGNAEKQPQRNAIAHLRELTTFYRCLGSYPVGRIADPHYAVR